MVSTMAARSLAHCASCAVASRAPGNHGKHEQQQALHDGAISHRSAIRVDLEATRGFDDQPASETRRAANDRMRQAVLQQALIP